MILVTGDTGLLGPYLKTAFTAIGDVTGVSTSVCDLTNQESVKKFLGKTEPQIIVHAAALTNVDKCSFQPHLAVVHNCGMVENLVRHMPPACRFVYISTDSIYSGVGPHREHSKSENPINMYGMSKFMGEFAAAKAANHLIVRTNMYGFARSPLKKGLGLVDWLADRLRSGREFDVYTDIIFNPLWTKTLAQKLVVMARSRRTGIFNLGASSSMSKAKFAVLLADCLGLKFDGARPMESKGIKDRVVRPLDTRMDITRAEGAFALGLPSMELNIREMCEELKCTN